MRLKAVLDHFQDPKLAWEADQKQLIELGIPRNTVEILVETRRNFSPEDYAKSIEESGIKWLTIFDECYPKNLKQIYDPPVVLYYKGEILPQDEKAIAVVGTRKMTGYGKLVTEKFTKDLVAAGLTIVSGLARGVDACAHQAALTEGGRTLAVLGGGLNNIYPPENTLLAKQIQTAGAVLTEFPPDYPSMPGNFPARNRIISGLSRAVLVTEASSDSGSLITARLALEQGRDVFAIPGPVTSELSRGPADLIKEGARLTFEANEILEELGWDKSNRSDQANLGKQELSPGEKQLLETLQNENKHIDEICRELNLSAAEVSADLLKMEILGIVRNLGNGIYCKV